MSWKPAGDGRHFAELIEEEMGAGFGQAPEDLWISRAMAKAGRASLRYSITAFAGSALAALAVIRPFPSTIVNILTASTGLLLFASRRRPYKVCACS